MVNATITKKGNNQPEMGGIPDDWDVKKLGEIGSFSKGQGIRKDQAQSGELPCIRYGELYTRHSNYIKQYYSFISKEIADTAKKLAVGDILFAGSGETKEEIGKCAAFIDSIDAYAGGDIVIFSPHSTDSLFLGYLLNSPIAVKQKASKGQGNAVVHISASNLKDVQIPVPPKIEEQTAIATVLSDTDALIERLEKLIAKKIAIKQGTMQQLLTGKKRLPGFSGEWKVVPLKDLIQVPVTDGPHLTPKFLQDGIPFLSVNNLVNNRIALTNLRYISKNDHDVFSRKCKPQKEDILLGKAASVGLVAVVDLDFDFNIWSPIALIRLSNQHVPKFIYYSFQCRYVINQIKLFTNSSSQGNIGMGDIEEIDFLVPSLEEQTAIASILSDMDAEIESLEQNLDKYTMLKQGMMQQLLTGRIRIHATN